MHTNNPKDKITINKESVIYFLVFVLYTAMVVLVFIYATKFLSTNINIALSTPASSEINAKYGQLDLENYALVANKLGLKKSAPVNQEVTLPNTVLETSTPIEITTSSPENLITATPTPPIINPAITPEITEVKPTIVINNSTNTAGLAAQLKNKLIAAGYQVIRTGNIKPSVATTVIKSKTSLNQDSKYLIDIKKIVDINYDFNLETLAANSDHDIEIIIGNK
jgi:hypothetical protein